MATLEQKKRFLHDCERGILGTADQWRAAIDALRREIEREEAEERGKLPTLTDTEATCRAYAAAYLGDGTMVAQRLLAAAEIVKLVREGTINSFEPRYLMLSATSIEKHARLS